MSINKELVVQIIDLVQFEQVLKSNDLVVLDFYSTSCPPCTVVAPLYQVLAEKYPNAKFYKINGLDEEGAKIQKSIDVEWWPTFVIFYKQREVWRAKIPNPPQQFPTEELEENLLKVYQRI